MKILKHTLLLPIYVLCMISFIYLLPIGILFIIIEEIGTRLYNIVEGDVEVDHKEILQFITIPLYIIP